MSFTYDDVSPWPTAADGGGPSLEIIDPFGDANSGSNWRASFYVGGTPGGSGVPGDYDNNGVVQETDHAVWRAHYGMAVAPGMHGDGNGDGLIDIADYIVWRNNLGLGASTAITAPVEVVTASSNVGAVASPAPSVAGAHDEAIERLSIAFEPAESPLDERFRLGRNRWNDTMVTRRTASDESLRLLLVDIIAQERLVVQGAPDQASLHTASYADESQDPLDDLFATVDDELSSGVPIPW
jgi:hypothetical protein